MGYSIETEARTVLDVPQKLSMATVLACTWSALLLAAVCLLPFLNKPFLIDDPWFLSMAHQVTMHPAHPMDFTICWNNSLPTGSCRKAYQFASGNPLMGQIAQGYVLVPTVLGGSHPWSAHLTQLGLVWLAALALTSLILRLGWSRWHAIVGALLLVCTAPFLPMASTAMPDVLATAVALVAIERLVAWKAEQKRYQAAVAGIALGLAGFARSHLVLLLPLAAFCLLDGIEPKQIAAQLRRRLWLWTPVVIGSGVLLAVIATTREHNLAVGTIPVLSGLPNILSNFGSYLFYLVFPMPLGICWAMNRLKTARLRIAIFVAIAVGCDFIFHAGLILFLVLMGLSMMGDLLYEALDKPEHGRLFLMLWLLIPLPIVLYIQLPAKYLLPCVPAVILLCFRLMQGFSMRFCRVAATVWIIASIGYNLLILHSDNEFAKFGRDAMYQLIQPHVAAGQRVWFADQGWSFWYAPLAGAKLIHPGGPQPRTGDLLVVGLMEGDGDGVLPRFPHRTLVQAVTHHYSFGRTLGGGIGLYTNRAGYWMWGLGESPFDRYELWRIDSVTK